MCGEQKVTLSGGGGAAGTEPGGESTKALGHSAKKGPGVESGWGREAGRGASRSAVSPPKGVLVCLIFYPVHDLLNCENI